MGRIRTIKPEFPQSESIGRLSREARLCFILLWTVVDDEGRTRASSRLLASLLYPYDDDARDKMEGWLAEIAREQCIDLYTFDGTAYLQICKWLIHQKIDHPGKSRLPAFDESSRILANNSESVAPDLGPRTVVSRTLDLGPRTKEQKPSRGKRESEFSLPDWIDGIDWLHFEEHRVRIRKKMTDHARNLAVKELDALRNKGHTPRAMIDQAILKGWQTFYEPSHYGGSNGTARQNGFQTRDDRNLEELRKALRPGNGDGPHQEADFPFGDRAPSLRSGSNVSRLLEGTIRVRD